MIGWVMAEDGALGGRAGQLEEAVAVGLGAVVRDLGQVADLLEGLGQPGDAGDLERGDDELGPGVLDLLGDRHVVGLGDGHLALDRTSTPRLCELGDEACSARLRAVDLGAPHDGGGRARRRC